MMTAAVVGGCSSPACPSSAACTAGTCSAAAKRGSTRREATVATAPESGSHGPPRLAATSACNTAYIGTAAHDLTAISSGCIAAAPCMQAAPALGARVQHGKPWSNLRWRGGGMLGSPMALGTTGQMPRAPRFCRADRTGGTGCCAAAPDAAMQSASADSAAAACAISTCTQDMPDVTAGATRTGSSPLVTTLSGGDTTDAAVKEAAVEWPKPNRTAEEYIRGSAQHQGTSRVHGLDHQRGASMGGSVGEAPG